MIKNSDAARGEGRASFEKVTILTDQFFQK